MHQNSKFLRRRDMVKRYRLPSNRFERIPVRERLRLALFAYGAVLPSARLSLPIREVLELVSALAKGSRQKYRTHASLPYSHFYIRLFLFNFPIIHLAIEAVDCCHHKSWRQQ